MRTPGRYLQGESLRMDVIPPITRHCPECGHWGWRGRVDADDGTYCVEYPACGHRFEPVDNPFLN